MFYCIRIELFVYVFVFGIIRLVLLLLRPVLCPQWRRWTFHRESKTSSCQTYLPLVTSCQNEQPAECVPRRVCVWTERLVFSATTLQTIFERDNVRQTERWFWGYDRQVNKKDCPIPEKPHPSVMSMHVKEQMSECMNVSI